MSETSATTGKILEKLSTLAPGETRTFTYNGEQIPNQVFVKNDGQYEDANFVLRSGVETTWEYYGIVPQGETASLFVRWMNNEGTFYNRSHRASIEITGNGLFPKTHIKEHEE